MQKRQPRQKKEQCGLNSINNTRHCRTCLYPDIDTDVFIWNWLIMAVSHKEV